jgi:hypothetical protein
MDALRDEGNSLHRSGAGLSYTEAEERLILRHVRNNPKDTYKQVIDACALSCGRTTIKKILAHHGIANWKAKKRPFLTAENAATRLTWAIQHRGQTPEEWGMHM